MPATQNGTSAAYVDAVIERARPRPDAMDRALAEIGRAFGHPPVMFKIRLRRFIRRGAGHPANRARYGARVRVIAACSYIETAIAVVEGQYRAEIQKFGHQAALGGGQRLSTMVLAEMRLVLRYMRAHRLGLHPVIADVLGEAFAEAAP
jgi:hypothetical protein